RPAVMAEMLPQIEANEAGRLGAAIAAIAATLSGSNGAMELHDLITIVRIAPGRISISLNPNVIGERLGVSIDRIAEDALTFEAPFGIRRRGVETKIILGAAAREIDKTLIRNIVKATSWFEAIKSGKTYSEIAAREGVWKQRIQQMIGLAFLAPDIVEAIADGRQPTGLTTEWLRQNPLPASWDAQRALIAVL
ncbi:MAG: recombinase family protein, partial [Albidovulum sp.]